MPTTPRYLIVDDEPHLAERLAQRPGRGLAAGRCLGLWHDRLSTAEAIASQHPDVAFLDMHMPAWTACCWPSTSWARPKRPADCVVTAYRDTALEALAWRRWSSVCEPVEPPAPGRRRAAPARPAGRAHRQLRPWHHANPRRRQRAAALSARRPGRHRASGASGTGDVPGSRGQFRARRRRKHNTGCAAHWNTWPASWTATTSGRFTAACW